MSFLPCGLLLLRQIDALLDPFIHGAREPYALPSAVVSAVVSCFVRVCSCYYLLLQCTAVGNVAAERLIVPFVHVCLWVGAIARRPHCCVLVPAADDGTVGKGCLCKGCCWPGLCTWLTYKKP